MNFKIEQNQVPPEPEPVVSLYLAPARDNSVALIATSNGVTRTIMRFEDGEFIRTAHDPLTPTPGLKVDGHGRIKERE
jgi:hypothetical protein